MYIQRQITSKISQLCEKFPIVTLTGPRQSGKSTLLRNQFPEYRYISFEDPDIREMAVEDPKGLISIYDNKVIIDEAQKVPKFFSYLQTHTDLRDEAGMYLLAGSQNFGLLAAIDQSLAGRTAVLTLLPLSRSELQLSGLLPTDINDQIFKGYYPRIYNRDICPEDFYPSYIMTYVERDIRSLLKISDINKFVRFIRICAGRIGQMLNMASMSTEIGVSVPTIDSWLSVLEASYILYRLEPNFNNYNKRIVKTPKLYFYDTGLACNLLGIKSTEQLGLHYSKGALFENMVINQFLKNSYNMGYRPDLTFWRDSSGLEIDLIHTEGINQNAYEIKSGKTFSTDYFKGLDKWGKLAGTPVDRLSVIYAGEHEFSTPYGKVIPFSSFF
ncbi:MAG: ATP-binding protein [Muribaculaceae bacterium]|nr:ATP-binding protein [Muribaculaceae bacterium]